MLDKDARIGEQNSIYRRGMVLGLTMAEIMILILFTLLLALAAAFAAKEQRISELETLRVRFIETLAPDAEGVSVSDVVQQIERQSLEIIELEEKGQEIEDIIREIERQSGSRPSQAGDALEHIREQGLEVAQLEQALAEAEERAAQREQEMEGIASEVERQSGSRPSQAGDVIEHIGEQGSEVAQLEQALAEAEGRAAQREQEMEDIISEIERRSGSRPDPAEIGEYIKEASDLAEADAAPKSGTGKSGNEFPSCWLTETDRIESIFEVTFTSEGVRVGHRDMPHRDEDVEVLPLASVETGTILTIAEFRSQFEALYLWSVEEECRFYVLRYSSGQAVRADLVNAVNGYFYPGSSIQVVSGR